MVGLTKNDCVQCGELGKREGFGAPLSIDPDGGQAGRQGPPCLYRQAKPAQAGAEIVGQRLASLREEDLAKKEEGLWIGDGNGRFRPDT